MTQERAVPPFSVTNPVSLPNSTSSPGGEDRGDSQHHRVRRRGRRVGGVENRAATTGVRHRSCQKADEGRGKCNRREDERPLKPFGGDHDQRDVQDIPDNDADESLWCELRLTSCFGPKPCTTDNSRLPYFTSRALLTWVVMNWFARIVFLRCLTEGDVPPRTRATLCRPSNSGCHTHPIAVNNRRMTGCLGKLTSRVLAAGLWAVGRCTKGPSHLLRITRSNVGAVSSITHLGRCHSRNTLHASPRSCGKEQ